MSERNAPGRGAPVRPPYFQPLARELSAQASTPSIPTARLPVAGQRPRLPPRCYPEQGLKRFPPQCYSKG